MSDQLTFFDRPSGVDQDLVQFLQILESNGGWMTATAVLGRMGKLVDENERRALRRLASASPEIISGDLGYRHARYAKTEEITHFANRIESQAKRMMERVQSVRKFDHQTIG